MGRGQFIVLEGIDGSGKSTQARRLAENLKTKGFSVVLTREPADSPAGERLRKLAREGRKGVSKEEETRLFQEDRAWHCRNVIEPGLARGDTVVSDRYWYSTVAYQGALGADPLAIAKESREKFPAPDFVIYLHVTPKEALRRILASRPDGPAAAYEKESFLQKVLERYEAQIEPAWLVIDGTRPEEELSVEIFKAVLKKL